MYTSETPFVLDRTHSFTIQGDFLVHFMDIARDELAKKPDEVSVEKLQV